MKKKLNNQTEERQKTEDYRRKKTSPKTGFRMWRTRQTSHSSFERIIHTTLTP
jgi:hypothetical protein